MQRRFVIVSFLSALILTGCGQLEEVDYSRDKDVVYGRKWGTALTMDVLQPESPNGAAVVWIISGGWKSSAKAIPYLPADIFLDRGYTVFAVVHGAQPKFTVEEIIPDIQRAVRFIRSHAEGYGIDPNRIGIVGGSAGGHLALMIGSMDGKGDLSSKDAVDHASSRVQVVGCFYPPTDFLNYGGPADDDSTAVRDRLDGDDHKKYAAAFDFRKWDKETGLFQRIDDDQELRKILKKCSPITYVTEDDPPTLIIHGDADPVVPIQQSRSYINRMKHVGATGWLRVKAGAKHGWKNRNEDWKVIADWIDRHLNNSTVNTESNRS